MQKQNSDRRLLTISGLIIIMLAAWLGFRGVWIGIVDGTRTLWWPSVEGRVTWGKESSARLPLWPNLQVLHRSYVYTVDGVNYRSINYNVHGSFVGTSKEIDRFVERNDGSKVNVFYDPGHPSHAVLKRGIAFDRMTVFYLLVTCIGCALTFVGTRPNFARSVVAKLKKPFTNSTSDQEEPPDDPTHST